MDSFPDTPYYITKGSSMKITNVRTEQYMWKKEKPIQNGTCTFTHNTLNLAIIETDEGITGLGTSYDVSLVDRIAPKLLGKNPLDTENLWSLMWDTKFQGRRGLVERSISALDIALWDIKSKASGIPLYQLLGGYRKSIPCYIAGGYYGPGKGIKELQKEMEEYISWGVKSVKMKIGAASMAEDVKRVKAVREVIGDDINLMLDANCAYYAYEAIEMSRRVEEFHPYWFEEPVMADDYEGLKEFTTKSRIPLATGENEYTIYGFRDLVDKVHPSILNPDACSMGGITQYQKVAVYAQAHNLALSPHGQQQVHSILDLAVPNVVIAEFYPVQYDANIFNAFINPVHFDEKTGCLEALTVPGTGLDINKDFLNPYKVI